MVVGKRGITPGASSAVEAGGTVLDICRAEALEGVADGLPWALTKMVAVADLRN
jgi:hypothetical protein